LLTDSPVDIYSVFEAGFMGRRFLLLLALIPLAGDVLAEESEDATRKQWGDLTGRFLFDGEPPKPVKLVDDKDQDVVKGPIFDESLVVNEKTRGIANVFVWLVPPKDQTIESHPDYDRLKKEPVILEMKGLRFQPHCVIVRTGQILLIKQGDPIGHNAKVERLDNFSYSSIIPAGGPVKETFKKGEPQPLPICCSVHPWMSAVYLCQDHPYMALSTLSGEFTLRNLPVGKHKFVFWQQRCGWIKKIRRGGKDEEWNKGIIEIEIKTGKNDLGDILVPKLLFKLD
jgi:hypothetical protein